MTKALFLDRDGVINIEKNHLYKIEEFDFIDGIFATCLKALQLDYLLIIITNQSGIARGLYSETDFLKLTKWMLRQFYLENIKISKVYHCPHHPDFSGECVCRKPKPGMIIQAQRDYDINLVDSILVGDKETDIEAGITAGIGKNILVRSGHPVNERKTKADDILDDIKKLNLINYHR